MVAVRGSSLVLKRSNADSPETFTTVTAVQSCNFSQSGNPIVITTGDDVDGNGEIFNTYITGPKDAVADITGIAKSLVPIQSIQTDYATGATTNYQVVVPNVGTWEFTGVITRLDYSGEYTDVVKFTMTINLNAAPTYTAQV